MSYWSLRVAKTVELFVIQDRGGWVHFRSGCGAAGPFTGRQLAYAAAGHPPALLISPCLTLMLAEIR